MAWSDETPEERWRRRFWGLVAILVGVPLLFGIYAAVRFLPDRPVTYANIEEHFKYGSTGGERNAGFPYYIWRVMPQVCAKQLPNTGGKGYEAFGLIFEKGHEDLPIGVMRRRNLGIDRVFVNCAVCHHSTVRVAPNGPTYLYLGMPSARFDLGAFEQFLFDCVGGQNFSADNVVPYVEKEAGGLNLLDRYIVYPVAISLMRERVLMLKQRFQYFNPPLWGPGRVDTFNSAKAVFNFPFNDLVKTHPQEMQGAADFPSIWNQAERKKHGIDAHWDGNNSKVEERNKSAAFGTGTTPATIDLDAIARIEKWLLTKQAPAYPFPINRALADQGAPLYKKYCADCHGASGTDFSGKYIGAITPIEQIGTDRYRLDSYTYDLALNQSTLYAGEPYRFTHFRKTFGYANMPLDGIWLRAPYLHNGSVPTLRDLLEPAALRPKVFYRGDDLYDQVKVGFVSTVADENGRKYWRYDTSLSSNGNAGHEGRVKVNGTDLSYGTDLTPAEKDAIVEYLKTFGEDPLKTVLNKP